MEAEARGTHLVCPHCHTTNRVPAGPQRRTDGHCGRCGKPLFDGHPAALTTAEFERHLARNDVPVVVDFWAPWCGPCRAMAPQFEAAARELEPDYRFVKVDTERERAIAARYGIQSIPTLAIFRGGREVARVSGVLPAARLAAWIRQHA